MNAPELSLKSLPVWALLIFASSTFAADPQSPWAQPPPTGELVYQSLPLATTSWTSHITVYMRGGVALPTVPVNMKVRPTGGDDTAAIQTAIEAVAALQPVNGIRGAAASDDQRPEQRHRECLGPNQQQQQRRGHDGPER